MQYNRVPPFQDFRVSDSGVGHVGVHPAATYPPRACPRPSSNGLIIGDVRVTKCEVVHAALHDNRF